MNSTDHVSNTNPSQTLPRDLRGGNTSSKNLLFETSIMLLPKPKTPQENYRPLFLMTISAKNPQENTVKPNPTLY